LLDQAAGKGIRIDSLSFIETESICDTTMTHRIQQLRSTSLTAVFTSMNAVEAVAWHLTQPALQKGLSTKQSVSPATAWRIFCIGAATRALAEARLDGATIAGTATSASALADVISKQAPPEVFFFCGDQRREELPEKLTSAGIQVHELVIYKTTRTPHRLSDVYDGILFFSPSAVHSFFSMNGTTEKTILFAIGKTTADSIRTYVNNVIITSIVPEKEALVKQLIDYFDHMHGGHSREGY
jgi:uroporphyrinogen-III synthase